MRKKTFVYSFGNFSNNSNLIVIYDCSFFYLFFAETININYDIIYNILYDTDVFYFGGIQEYRCLDGFSITKCYCNLIDLQVLCWNIDTSKLNPTINDCIETLIEKYKLDKDNIPIETINDDYVNILLQSFKKTIANSCVVEDKKIIDVLLKHFQKIIFIEKIISENMLSFQEPFCEKIDNMAIKNLKKLEDSGIRLDRSYIKKLLSDSNKELNNCLNNIYSLAGCTFNINSTRETNYIFKKLGILNNNISKTDLVSNYDNTALLIFKYINKYRSINIFVEQYLKPLQRTSEHNEYGRFKYNTTGVPCLTKGHFCIEMTKGLIDISEIVVGDKIWTEFGFKKVLSSKQYATNDLIKICLTNGISLTGTSHHPILVNKANHEEKHKKALFSISREWCSLENLFIGEKVILSSDSSKDLRDIPVVNNIAKRLCDIINLYLQYDNEYLCLKSIRLSQKLSLFDFKGMCCIVGLKNDSICIDKEHNVYDVIFYDYQSIASLKADYKKYLSNNSLKNIEYFISKSKKPSLYKRQKNYCFGNYEEASIVEIKKIQKPSIVYDIEIEDVHEYNANGIINHNTGRLSSSQAKYFNDNFFCKLNIQSVPKKEYFGFNIRKCFLPEKDCTWCRFDFKSQEIRLAAYLYKIDFINKIKLENDIYTEIGNSLDFIQSIKTNDISKKRNITKIICLGLLYGLTDYGISKQLSNIVDDEKLFSCDYREEFCKLLPELVKGQKKTIEYAHSINGIYTLSGRYRKICFSNYDKQNFFTRNNRIALNTVIQGTCGDIIREVINRLSPIVEQYSKYGFRILNTIHDEINFSIPCDSILEKEIIDKISSIMSMPILNRDNLCFGYSFSKGNSWGCLT